MAWRGVAWLSTWVSLCPLRDKNILNVFKSLHQFHAIKVYFLGFLVNSSLYRAGGFFAFLKPVKSKTKLTGLFPILLPSNDATEKFALGLFHLPCYTYSLHVLLCSWINKFRLFLREYLPMVTARVEALSAPFSESTASASENSHPYLDNFQRHQCRAENTSTL